MKLFEYDRERFGGDKTAINRHSVRRYVDIETGDQYTLDKTLDGAPPFYHAEGPRAHDRTRPFTPSVKHLAECWGDGWPWRKAVRALLQALDATIVGRCPQYASSKHDKVGERLRGDQRKGRPYIRRSKADLKGEQHAA